MNTQRTVTGSGRMSIDVRPGRPYARRRARAMSMDIRVDI